MYTRRIFYPVIPAALIVFNLKDSNHENQFQYFRKKQSDYIYSSFQSIRWKFRQNLKKALFITTSLKSKGSQNAIRPVAIGRKNYLFADSHATAQRAAMIYSRVSTCKVHHQVNPFECLRDAFAKLPNHPPSTELRNCSPNDGIILYPPPNMGGKSLPGGGADTTGIFNAAFNHYR